jgi:hypothetical protein
MTSVKITPLGSPFPAAGRWFGTPVNSLPHCHMPMTSRRWLTLSAKLLGSMFPEWIKFPMTVALLVGAVTCGSSGHLPEPAGTNILRTKPSAAGGA